eukprot:1939992-Prymnesium_polylepis.2
MQLQLDSGVWTLFCTLACAVCYDVSRYTPLIATFGSLKSKSETIRDATWARLELCNLVEVVGRELLVFNDASNDMFS